MIDKGKSKGTIRFSFPLAEGVKKVAVAGDFNKWQAASMRKQKSSFALTLPVSPGEHQYKFVVDGQWVLDPDNAVTELSDQGTVNSVLRV